MPPRRPAAPVAAVPAPAPTSASEALARLGIAEEEPVVADAGPVEAPPPPPVEQAMPEEVPAGNRTLPALAPEPPPAPPRAQPVRRPAPVSGPAPLRAPAVTRRPLATAFSAQTESLLVYRIVNGEEELIPKEWGREYLDAVGLTQSGIETFVLRNVAPDWGGGEYLVRCRLPNGQFGGQSSVFLGGEPKTPTAAPVAAPPVVPGAVPAAPPGADPRIWAQTYLEIANASRGPTLPPGKTIGDAIAEVEGLRALSKMQNSDGAAAAQVAALQAKIDALEAKLAAPPPPPPPAPPPPPPVDEIDKYIRLRRALEPERPVGPDPQVTALAEQVRRLTESNAELQRSLSDQRQQAQDRELAALREEVQRLKSGDGAPKGPQGFTELGAMLEEAKEFAEKISPPAAPSGGASVADVAMKLLDQWSPPAVANLWERGRLADQELVYAKAKADIARRRGLPAALPDKKKKDAAAGETPPLAHLVPREEVEALVKARGDMPVLEAVSQVVSHLIDTDDENLKTASGKLFAAVRKGDESALTLQVAAMVRAIAGAGDWQALAERVAGALVRHKDEVIKHFDGAEAEAPSAPAEEKAGA